MLENTKNEAWRRLRICIYGVFVLRAEKVTFSRQFRFNTNAYKLLESSYIHANACRYLQSLYTVSSNIIQMESSCKKTNTNPGDTRLSLLPIFQFSQRVHALESTFLQS